MTATRTWTIRQALADIRRRASEVFYRLPGGPDEIAYRLTDGGYLDVQLKSDAQGNRLLGVWEARRYSPTWRHIKTYPV